MAATLAQDLRDRVIQSIRGGLSCRAAARRFNIAPATAIRWYQRYTETGSAKPGKRGGYRGRHRIEPYAPLILGWIEEQRDITLAELQAKLKAEHNVDFAIGTLWYLLHRHAITVKKNRPCRRAGTRRHSSQASGLVRRSKTV